MKYLSITFLFLSVSLLTQTTNAETANADLIKVAGEKNIQCVEYFSYQGEMYCSTKPTQSQPIDPNLKDNETQKIIFDVVLHYAIKEPDMGKKKRTLWIKNLSGSKIKLE